jgi:ketosteroid isomerase-like protein
VVHDGRMSATSEMADLLKTFYSSISTGDPSAFAASMASDVLVIGTDEVEWWQGKDEVLRVMEAQVSEMHDAGIRFTGGDPQVFDSGDAVWAADRPTPNSRTGLPCSCVLAWLPPAMVMPFSCGRCTCQREPQMRTC